MSFRAMRAAWALPIPSPAAKLVALALADFKNDKTGRCDPSLASLSAKTLLSRSTIKRALLSLEAGNFISIDRRAGCRATFSLKYDRVQNEPGQDVEPGPNRTGSKLNRVHSEPGTGFMVNRDRVHGEPRTYKEPVREPIPPSAEATRTIDPGDFSKAVRKEGELFPTAEPESSPKRKAISKTAKRKPNAWGTWVDCNRATGRRDPTPTGPDRRASKELGRLVPDLGELGRIFEAYLRDGDPWLARQGHALRHLPGRIDAYRNGRQFEETPDEAALRLAKELKAGVTR